MEEIYYCKCCGYQMKAIPDSYGICEICYWEDDPIQNEDYFYIGGANTFPLVIAKANFELFGVSEERFKTKVVSATNQIRDPEYQTSREIVINNFSKLEKEIKEYILEGEYDLFHYFVDNYYSYDLFFSRELSEKLLSDEKCRFTWVKLSRKYFENLEKNDTRKVWGYLDSMHHNSWEELQDILREFG